MSQREPDAIQWIRARKGPGGGGVGGGLIIGGGSQLLKTPRHKLDGPEHQVADDTTRLDATTEQHGLLPRLSGDPTDALLGDGTWGSVGGGMVPYYIPDGETFTVPLYRQALFSETIDGPGTLDVVGMLIEVD